MKKAISSIHAPRSTDIYSQAIESNGFVFVSGQIHMTTEGVVVEASVEGKLEQIMDNITAILKEAGLKLDNIVKITVYLTSIDDAKEFNAAYGRYFVQPLPARELVCVQALPRGATIELSVIAARSTKSE